MIFSAYTAGESLFIFNSDEDEARYYQIINEIRCPKCTSGSLSSSNAPISEDLKRKIYGSPSLFNQSVALFFSSL